MVNQGGADSGIPACSAGFSHVIVQDDINALTWAGLGGEYDSVVVFDDCGVLAGKVKPLVYPEAGEQIAALVGKLVE